MLRRWFFVLLVLGASRLGGQAPRRYLVTVRNPIDTGVVALRARRLGHEASEIGRRIVLVTERSSARGGRPGLRDSLLRLREERRAGVNQAMEIEEDVILRPLDVATSWGRDSVGARLAWAAGYVGTGAKIGDIDSGIYDADRADFAHLHELNTSGNGRALDDATDDTGVCNGHGPWVNSAMASRTWGVAPDAEMWVAKGAGNYSGCGMFLSSMINAVTQMTAAGVKIISVSYAMSDGGLMGGGTSCGAGCTALLNARNAGVTVFLAAGNEGAAAPYGLANDTNAVAIMALNSNGTIASFSNRGGDLSCPGVGVIAAGLTKSGTSMATPYCAAAAGLAKGACPSLSWRGLFDLIRATADTVPDMATTKGRGDGARAIAGCTGGVLFAGPRERVYTAPQMDSLRIVSTGAWSVLPSPSNPFRRGDYVVWTVVGSDRIRIVGP
jgi:hypothetical protein